MCDITIDRSNKIVKTTAVLGLAGFVLAVASSGTSFSLFQIINIIVCVLLAAVSFRDIPYCNWLIGGSFAVLFLYQAIASFTGDYDLLGAIFTVFIVVGLGYITAYCFNIMDNEKTFMLACVAVCIGRLMLIYNIVIAFVNLGKAVGSFSGAMTTNIIRSCLGVISYMIPPIIMLLLVKNKAISISEK